MYRKKGVVLLITLCLMVIMGVLLMGVVKSLGNNIFFTKKTAMEIKSYWAAKAGLEYANTMLAKNAKWPSGGVASDTRGGFTISLGDGEAYIVKGEDNETGTLFYIPFYKTFGTGVVGSVANLGLNYYSFNNTGKDGEKPVERRDFVVSPLEQRKVTIPMHGVYVASEGRTGAFKCNLEELLSITTQSVSGSSGAIYAVNGINATNLGKPLKIQMKTNGVNVASGASIVSKGAINISCAVTDESPLDLAGGHLYVGTNATLNGSSISPRSIVNKYSIAVLNSASIKAPDFPDPKKEGVSIPSGTFAWVQLPSSAEENTVIYSDFYSHIFTKEHFRKGWFDPQVKDGDYQYGIVAPATPPDGGGGDGTSGGGDSSSGGEGSAAQGPSEEEIFNEQYDHFISTWVDKRVQADGETAAEKAPGTTYYEPCFIPSALGIYNPEAEKPLSLSNVEYAYAKEILRLRNLLKEQKEAVAEQDQGWLGNLLNRVFRPEKYQALMAAQEAQTETEETIKEYEQNPDVAHFEFVAVDPGESGSDTFYVLEKLGQGKTNYASEFTTDKINCFGFKQNNRILTLELKKSISAEDGFNFATLERGVDSYFLSRAKRGILKMGGTDSDDQISIYSGKDININGIVTGKGQLFAEDSVSIEAGADVDGGQENYLAVYSNNGDINLKQISATASSVSGDGTTDSSYSSANPTFDVLAESFVTNVLGIGPDQRRCNEYVTGEKTISYADLCKNYEINGKVYPYYLLFDGYDITPSGTNSPDAPSDAVVGENDYIFDRARAKVMEYLRAQSAGEDYAISSNFKGILSSKGDINIKGSSNYDLGLEGIILCNGTLNISDLNRVKITYDPSLSSILANLPGATFEPSLSVIGVNRISY